MSVVQELTTQAVDYLQRTDAPLALDGRLPATGVPVPLRRMSHVLGVGRYEKDALPQPGEESRVLTEDLLVGLYGRAIPVAFEIAMGPEGPKLALGTWPLASTAPANADDNAHILETMLASIYPSVEFEPAAEAEWTWSHAGLALGIPSTKPPETLDGSLPIDRLLRALGSGSWAALVLAEPVSEEVTRDVRMRLVNEMRAVAEAASGLGRGPLAEHYTELLKLALNTLTKGQGGGAWRTAVYLAGDEASFRRLTSVWRGVYLGADSLPEPIRVFDAPGAAELARGWVLPDKDEEDAAPGVYRHPFTYQTLLTSAQLAAYIHLPRLETQGFAVRLVPDFDVVPTPVEGERVLLGKVAERNAVGEAAYEVARDRLTSHAFVTGVTGSGKTNTVFQLLIQGAAAGVPFLVIEPAKTEYRALLEHELVGSELEVYTLGTETVAPFRINPFEFPEHTPVGVHLDLLRSVFNVSFGMWTPLPQVLEVCLHEIYFDRGWDVATNTNSRLAPDDDRSLAFPTLSELLAKVDEVVDELGYDDEVTGDMRAALRTRLNSLRSGAKGRMLDVQRSVELMGLLATCAILELEGLGDDDDKAFLMALLIARLAEERRGQGQSASLRHLLVVEEAHRVLANPQVQAGEYDADARGKAVETFANLLSEVRAYGQGIVVVDQIPTKLSPDVVKNTSLKVAHRIVAGDDRLELGAAMAMSERQQRALATLPRGRAAIFAEGEDVPLLVQVDRVDVKERATTVADDRVREHMAGHVHGFDSCRHACGEPAEACSSARRAAEDESVRRTLARLVLSSLFDPKALHRRWPELPVVADPQRPALIDGDSYLRALVVHGAVALAERRGAQAGWTYGATAAVSGALRELLLAQAGGANTEAALETLSAALIPLEARLGHGPFPACSRIWPEQETPCRCWFPIADLLDSGAYDEEWEDAIETDADEGGTAARWDVCQEVAYAAIEFPEEDWPEELRQPVGEVAIRVALCAGQQLLLADGNAHPRSVVRVIEELEEEA